MKHFFLIAILFLTKFPSIYTQDNVNASISSDGNNNNNIVNIPTGNVKNKDSIIEFYLNKYKQIAINEMVRSGIPASITLAQGIIETEAGMSRLSTDANNHFGIKCRSDWKGEKIYHDDDSKGECFRKYDTDLESYADHSIFLRTSTRYAKLFTIDPLKYEEWGQGLKKAGYATNPKYPYMLNKIIEDYGLQKYTIDGLLALKRISNEEYNNLYSKVIYNKNPILGIKKNTPASGTGFPYDNVLKDSNGGYNYFYNMLAVSKNTQLTTDSMLAQDHNIESEFMVATTTEATNKISFSKESFNFLDESNFNPDLYSMRFSVNKLKVIEVVPGTSILSVAIKYNIPYDKLLEYNDLPSQSNLITQKQLLYLEPKRLYGNTDYYIVSQGETMYHISQQQGVSLVRLREFNFLPVGMEPKKNEKIYLMYNAPVKPDAYVKD